MFSHFFGNYLIRNEKITKQQFHEILLIQKTIRVKLGLMAVASRLLTVDQADQPYTSYQRQTFWRHSSRKRLSNRRAG